ncbi:MAG: hypothetical protein ACFFCI_03645 [Promethearchaeota archaeon]
MIILKGKNTTKKSGNGSYKSSCLYIPSRICKNSVFPFSDNEEVLIVIVLIVKTTIIKKIAGDPKIS